MAPSDFLPRYIRRDISYHTQIGFLGAQSPRWGSIILGRFATQGWRPGLLSNVPTGLVVRGLRVCVTIYVGRRGPTPHEAVGHGDPTLQSLSAEECVLSDCGA